MSWGYKIIIVLVIFVTGILSMVYIAMQQTNETVDANYYEREMKYQDIIDGKNNLSRLGDTVSLNNNGEMLTINFPAASVNNIDSGKVEMMRMSDSKDDRSVILTKNGGTIYNIPIVDVSKGWYKIRAEWSNSGIGYYYESSFNVQ